MAPAPWQSRRVRSPRKRSMVPVGLATGARCSDPGNLSNFEFQTHVSDPAAAPGSARGPSGHSSPLLASLPIPGRPLHPPLDIKHFLTFRLNGTSPLNLFPNFNTSPESGVNLTQRLLFAPLGSHLPLPQRLFTHIAAPKATSVAGSILLETIRKSLNPWLQAPMDPVQKAVISHTFGVPAPLKKKQFISCNICHLRFNSANQAEAHYKGHKHARRLKAIEAMKNKQKVAGAAAGTPGQDSTADLAPSPVGSGELGSTENLFRHRELSLPAHFFLFSPFPPFLPLLPADASSPQESEGEGSSLGLVPSTEESPVELPGSVAPLGSPPASELSEGTSDATSVASSSAQAAEAQAAESGSSVSSAPESEKEGKKSKQHLYCPTCKVTVNSLSQLEAHNTGAKHKSMLEGHGTQLRRGRGKLLSRAGHKSKRIGNKGSINIQNKAFHCQVCEIYVNSETQLKQHMSSRRHKDRLAGKPPKPKYSPYNKLQKNAALAVSILKSKLALQKHLTKTLATRFLPSPLTAAAVCAMPGPLALRPAAATTLFQAPILGPALFRTPPAHVRPTPGPIVFAPY
ncbi:zinc finger protein 385C [Hirundo rustica]|uniref:zinc finger protein 385C n=1 Tax=Hirundo rustica TaxID=43150 RepID=UPI002673E03B|nr:zinc finger protein 385C [Hirundo rustica]